MDEPKTAAAAALEAHRILEPSPESMREILDYAAEKILEHIATLPDQTASDVVGGEELSQGLIEDLPRTGRPFPELADQIFDQLAHKSFNTAGPGFMAFIPGGGIFPAAVADLMANVTNRYVTVWTAAPGLVRLEMNVVRWFRQMVGYPSTAGGYLTSGGSMANFGAIVAARQERLPENFLGGTLYASDQVHHSVTKAAVIAGFPVRNVRNVPSDERYRIRLDLLEAAIAEDRTAGLEPFLIVGSAGTTNTGAVDDLEGLARIAREQQMWLHLDAAYGGFFLLTQRGREIMQGLEAADSITLDPHKGLFLPYGTGCLLVRDAAALKRTFSLRAEYMPPPEETPVGIDFCDISPELSRDFRGLRVWLPLKLFGSTAFQQALDEKIDLTLWATEQLREMSGIEIVAEPQLTVVAFRLALPDLDIEEANRLNREFLDRVNAKQRVFLTGTVLDGGFVSRICVLQFRTHFDRVQLAIEDINEVLQEMKLPLLAHPTVSEQD